MKPQQITILIVDGDTENISRMAGALESKGFEVRIANSPEQVLSDSSARSVHLVLSEANFASDLDGLALLGQLIQADRQLCAMIMTSQPSLDGAIKAMQLGVCDYLAKPIDTEQLLSSVETTLGKRGVFLTTPETINKVIGARLRTIRRDRKLTTQQLADRVGVTQSQISQIETGRSAASVVTLYNISQALEMGLADLLEGI